MAALKSSVEVYNIDHALAVFDNNQFQLILAAAVRAREIATARTIAERAGSKVKYANRASVTALTEFAEGKAGKEYLDKVKK
jgi:DNA-directed RNA polymerase subunit K/omega